MTLLRFASKQSFSNESSCKQSSSIERISDIFGSDVFNMETMRHYLPKDAYDSVCTSIKGSRRIDRKIANQVASGMKAWAMERGATHYSHWFHPLNNTTAEKHDAFFEPIWSGGSFETFRGDVLVQQEPDASSFPNGGLRNTFEARGYSAWDPTSPAFILDQTLCIPSIFVAYTGAALDFKTPLIKSLSALEKAAVDICQYFDKDITNIDVTLGWEQEYFLVDQELFEARPDLIQTGRTLMGHSAAKSQQLEDHYFGAIPSRVSAFMKEFENWAYRLGIPLKTRHNEAAPSQFECAAMFEEANIAVDHNSLLMTLMKKIAPLHKLVVLFHEKPYNDINGSGKHCNWSLCTNTGVNLLAPGKTPKTNIQFLVFFVSTIKAAHDYGLYMMASIASHSNALRLGSNEAPPSVMSVFTGTTLNEVLDSIEQRVSDKKMTPDEKSDLKLDIGKIPEILLDNTDRNRTSPFAFTGNRFEFRATGSSSNCAIPLIVINTAVAEELQQFKKEADSLINTGVKKDEAVLQVIRKYIHQSKNIRFEGNNYSEEWHDKALKERGLEVFKNVPAAIKSYLRPEFIELFERHNIMTEVELKARYEVKSENYIKKIEIESRVIGDLAANHVIPTVITYQNILIKNVLGLKEIFPDTYHDMGAEEIKTIRIISNHVKAIRENSRKMAEMREILSSQNNIENEAEGYSNNIIPYMNDIRENIDALELIVDDKLWPLPKYRELLTIH